MIDQEGMLDTITNEDRQNEREMGQKWDSEC